MFGEFRKNIKQYAIVNNNIYFVSDKSFSNQEIKNMSYEFEYFQVPYIPYDNNGNPDEALLKAMNSPGSKLINKIYESQIPLRVKMTSEILNSGMTIPKYIPKLKKSEIKFKNASPAILDGGELLIRKKDDTLDQLIQKCKNCQTKIIYYDTENPVEECYSDIYINSAKKAEALRKKGLKPGDSLLFLFSSNKVFIETYWACVMLGVTVVPLESAQDYSVMCNSTSKIINIWKMLDEPYIITDHNNNGNVFSLSKLAGKNLNIIDTDTLKCTECISDIYKWNDNEAALILFTSGSTGLPKGVVLTQKNIFGRTLGEVQRYNLDNTEVDFNWMTLTHAAGLIWSHIRDIYLNIPQIQVKTDVILSQPIRFIEIMNKYRATITWAPNFAFSLIAGAVNENIKYDWDLSHIKYMFAGGEANISVTLRNFLKIFSGYGLNENVIRPAFGMTETSSCITYNDQFSLSSSSDSDKNIPIGSPMPGIKIRIVSGEGNVVNEGETGYIQCAGTTVTSGYYKNEDACKNSFTEDGYLITGDLGYIADGSVSITGREKDVIIVNGLNYFVQDIEAATDNIEGVLNSHSVAVAVPDGKGKESIVIFFVPEDESSLKGNIKDNHLTELSENIKITVRKVTGLSPDYIVPVSKNYIARTDIGKKQRNTYKNDYLAGKFDDNIAKISDKRKQLILSGKLVRDNGTKEQTDRYIVVDKFFLEDSYDISDKAVMKNVIEKTLKHIKIYTDTLKDITVVFPVEKSIPEMLDGKYNPVYSFVYGILKTVSLENEHFSFRLVDMDVYSDAILSKELLLADGRECVIYRNGLRYGYEYMPISNADIEEQDYENKLIVIAGGAGGTGKYISEYFVNEYNSKILLLGTSDRLKEISENIIYLKADITDIESVKIAIDEAISFFGVQPGAVLNLAGKISNISLEKFYNDSESHTVKNENTDNVFSAIDVKYYGTQNLYQISSFFKIPFIVFCSLTANFGGRYMCAYSGANSMQEMYCRYISQYDNRVKLISWSMWKDIGLSHGAGAGASLGGFNELETEEAIELFDAVLRRKINLSYIGLSAYSDKMKKLINSAYNTTIIIETGNEEDKKVLNEILSSEEFKGYNIICKVNETAFLKDSENKKIIESVLEVWKKTFKVDNIDINANIFDIGGNSVTVYILADNMSKEFGRQISASDIMTYPNIREMSAYLYLKNENSDISIFQKSDRTEQIKNARKRFRDGRRVKN